MYVDEPPKDGNIPDFNISKIDICPFRAYQRSFRLFHGNFSKDIHQRSQLLCFTQNDHTGHAGFKICPFLKWAQLSNKSLKILVTEFINIVIVVDTLLSAFLLNFSILYALFLSRLC